VGSGRISTSFEAHIDGIRPPVPGVTAMVLDGDLKLPSTQLPRTW
jgi:hypothetical protein